MSTGKRETKLARNRRLGICPYTGNILEKPRSYALKGYRAAQLNVALALNPYRIGTDKHDLWAAGWRAGKSQRKNQKF